MIVCATSSMKNEPIPRDERSGARVCAGCFDTYVDDALQTVQLWKE